MNTFSKLLILAVLLFSLTDCARSITYPVTVTATAQNGVTHSVVIEVTVVR